jgi:hypothetical protein
MGLESFLSRVIPVAIGYATGGPIKAVAVAASTEAQKTAERKAKQRANQAQAEEQRRINNMDPYLQSYTGGTSVTTAPRVTTQNAGFGSSFGTFLGDVGRNILNPIGQFFSSPALTPFISAQSRGQPAQPTLGLQMGQESSRSGTQEAFLGGFGNVLGTAGRLLKTPGGQIGLGSGIAGGLSMLSGSGSKVRITRKMKSQYRSVLNLAGGDYMMAADMIGVSDDFFIAVMLKRFRNDGPVVTKAALRKTKSTVRKLKNMCDMYDSLRPSATRRRAPMKRAATTLISNK